MTTIKAEHGTLTASTVKTVSLTLANVTSITVHFVSGTGPIYFTVDGSTPTVGGADTYVLHDGLKARSIGINSVDDPDVKLISATADGYSVELENGSA